MNLGNLPGYYWDTEKKKYFPILANHVAPEGAKYSRENVKREKEQSRKRRKIAAHEKKMATQTVRRSKILQSPLIAGISLSREQGASAFVNLEARITALARQSQVSELLSLKHCESCGKRDTVFDFAIDPVTDAMVLGLGSQTFGKVQYLSETQATYDLASFRSDISSVTITHSNTIIATATTSNHPGNVFVARMSEPSDEPGSLPVLESPAPSYLRLGNEETDLWTSSPNPSGWKDVIAIGGSEKVYMVGAEGSLLQTYHVGTDVRSLDWMSPTLAVGGTRGREVLLFDARAGGMSRRFHHGSGVTGIRGLGNSSQMVVAGFHGIAIYDVRMLPPNHPQKGPSSSRHRPSFSPSPAVLRMPLKTERPSVAMDVHPDANLLAIGDDMNVIRLHSLLTGKIVAELGAPDRSSWAEKEYISRLRFLDNAEGKPTLMTCQGADLHEWSWGGAEDDEI